MSQRIGLCVALVLALAAALPAFAQPDSKRADVQRETVGQRTSENIPAIPAGLRDQLNRYQNFRGAELAGWTRDGCLLISTRFAETAQVHRVCQPLGMREQLTFYPEPVSGITPAPAKSWRDGFVFARDKGGDEFSQLYWFDTATCATTLLTDGGRNQNEDAIFSRDGGLMAWTSTARNGTDHDIWLRDTRTGKARVLVDAGGLGSAMDFSPDGSQLLVMQYVSAAESHPGVVDVVSGKLTLFPVDGGKAAFGDFAFAPDGKAVYFVSDEPLLDKGGQPGLQEFKTLRFHDPAIGKFEVLMAAIPWDVEAFKIADDGRYLAFVSNEDGVSKLHVMALPSHVELALPELPLGVIRGLAFSPDGSHLVLALNSATSPSDVQVIDLAKSTATRWTAKGNPAKNIKDIDNVALVFKDGVGYDPAKLVKAAKGTVGQRWLSRVLGGSCRQMMSCEFRCSPCVVILFASFVSTRGVAMRKHFLLFACLLASSLLHAEVTSVDVASRQPWIGSQSFGPVGAYEVLRGTVHYAIDPRSAAARAVADIRLAPVNAHGLVEYSGPFLIIRPVDPARGNHTTLVEVANRSRTQMDGLFFKSEGDRLDLMAPDKVEALTDPTFFTLGCCWRGWVGAEKVKTI